MRKGALGNLALHAEATVACFDPELTVFGAKGGRLAKDQWGCTPIAEIGEGPVQLSGQLHHQMRQKGAMHDKTCVAFDIPRIVRIVVDTVPVEGQR